jgi:uncharacterized membrane protein YphA (DoxX/SURF4 family)
MIRIMFGVFVVLHGLVHLLYFGQSAKYFELKSGMVWPAGAWAFSRLVGDKATKSLARVMLILAAICFVVSGISLFSGQAWWRTVVVCAAAFSSIVYILLWDGRMQNLDGQGGVGILINIAILIVVLILLWPDFGF